MHLRPIAAFVALGLALGAADPARAQQPAADPAGCPGLAELFPGRTPAAVADSLFALARVRGSRERYQLVAYTRAPRRQPADNGGGFILGFPDMDRLLHGGLSAVVATLIDSEGRPVRVEIVQPSGDAQFDQYALGTTRAERYRPALAGSCPVPYFQVIPFQVRAEREVRIAAPQR